MGLAKEDDAHALRGGFPPTIKGVTFLESTPPIYAMALRRQAARQSRLPDGWLAVVYRASNDNFRFFLSRQLDPNKGGDELWCKGESKAIKRGYDLFSAPAHMVKNGEPEPDLIGAIKEILEFSQEPPPSDGGP